MQVNNVPVIGLCPGGQAFAYDSASARTVTVKERLETGTLFLRKSLTAISGSKKLVSFAEAGHGSLLFFDAAQWQKELAQFLDRQLKK
ncbi:MAG: hypothetical protein F6J93_02725 [Oscillatoria sp. SIO1A7]|nr:hypothetical protein [Oscillatoria sp. SIO1A7]